MLTEQYLLWRCLISFLCGAIIGAYTNTLSYRIHTDISILTNDCYCPLCGEKINLLDQIPVISYLILRGKSKCCGKVIDPHYLWIELSTALWYMLTSVMLIPLVWPVLILGTIWLFACLFVEDRRMSTKIRWKKAFGGGGIVCIYQLFVGTCLAILNLSR